MFPEWIETTKSMKVTVLDGGVAIQSSAVELSSVRKVLQSSAASVGSEGSVSHNPIPSSMKRLRRMRRECWPVRILDSSLAAAKREA